MNIKSAKERITRNRKNVETIRKIWLVCTEEHLPCANFIAGRQNVCAGSPGSMTYYLLLVYLYFDDHANCLSRERCYYRATLLAARMMLF